MKTFRTVNIQKLPDHHSGVSMGFKVASNVLPNCVRTVDNEPYAIELANYWESVADSM